MREWPKYLSYLLRLWRVSQTGASAAGDIWRASLESPHTGERWNFASLDELFDFLEAQINGPHQVETVDSAGPARPRRPAAIKARPE